MPTSLTGTYPRSSSLTLEVDRNWVSGTTPTPTTTTSAGIVSSLSSTTCKQNHHT